MRKYLVLIIFQILSIPAFSQGWVILSGTVTDSVNDLPVANHPVTIMSDSTSGFFYYNVVLTDTAGYYHDEMPIMADSTGILFIETADCNGFVFRVTIVYNPVNYSFVQDFMICTSIEPCEAYFSYDQVDNMMFQFTDLSIGNPDSWYWEFGDGSISSAQNPVHQFNTEGWFTVTLSVSNPSTACFDSYSGEIFVYDSLGGGCESNFSYYADPQGPPDAFQFIDLSSGNIISWSWSFGDGTISVEQNPFHQYPGPGTFEACLTITGNNCTDTFCSEIVISDTVYQQIYGQVFAGNFPLQQGRVTLFSMNPSGAYLPLGDDCAVDSNGIYFFTLVPQGNYFIQALPGDSTGYLPTYYGDVTNWQSAAQVVLGEPDNPYNINLVGVPAGSEYFGPGSITGQINNLGMNRTLAENVNMILLDENIRAIGFTKVSNSGQFEFPSLDYGAYHLRAELPGVGSDNMKFEISQENPHMQVVMNYTGNSVLGLQDLDPFEGSFSVYPNPVKDRLHISVKLPSEVDILVELHSMTGNIVYKNQESVEMGEMIFEINVSGLSTGIYTLNVYSDNGMIFTRKVVIVR